MLCVSIMAKNNEEAVEKMAEAAAYADLYELRLDFFMEFDLAKLVAASPRPLIVTYRSKKEGGLGRAPYKIRLRYLHQAVSLGVEYVDLEYSLPLEYRAPLLSSRGKSKIIISKHFCNHTPRRADLKRWLHKLVSTGADVAKLVTKANDPLDNLRVLELMPLAHQLGVPIIAFCMGEYGKISRIASVLMGGLLTFACLNEKETSAPGQIAIKDMKTIFKILKGDNSQRIKTF